ncbi:MAG: bifunctional diaminohydroxyphosphoribosylaminopyrimidine deaminase/5-amino-6-(5-phosphoribosylamino)uracil reductase RibD [Gammaproteobacteria bacterium]
MNKNLNDQAFMAEALQLASKGLYTTRTNPRVGCVIVKDNVIIGRGYHVSPGNSHAEVLALESIADSEGATAYVSLEPCSHHGNTPPCADALVAAKVSRVVVAMTDPNPLVQGKGLKYLQNNGIEIDVGLLAMEAAELNKGFVKRMQSARPYVTVKSAISLDGKTAMKSGESKWISCDQSRADVQKLRVRRCAIMTGVDTVIADDPNLTVRITRDELGIKSNFEQPIRVILDTNLRISPNAKVLQNGEEVIIYTCVGNNDISTSLRNNNIEVMQVKKTRNHIDLDEVMKNLAGRGVNEVLIEAGSTLVGNILEHKLVDEMIVYMAPHMMGNANMGMANLDYIQNMQDRIEFDYCQIRKIGNDVKLQLKPKYIN